MGKSDVGEGKITSARVLGTLGGSIQPSSSSPRIRKMKNSGIIQERFKVRRTKRKEVGKSWLPWTPGFFRYFVLVRTVQGQADQRWDVKTLAGG